jgi:hypothetical protein
VYRLLYIIVAQIILAGQKFVKQEYMTLAEFEAKLQKEVDTKAVPDDADWLGEEPDAAPPAAQSSDNAGGKK